VTTTPLSDAELLIRLHVITPELFVEPELLAELSRDLWPVESKMAVERDLLPVAAVMPSDLGDLIAVVRLAASAGRPLIPRGGGTGLTGGLEAMPGAIIVDLRGLNVIDPVNERNLTVRVDAGVHGGELTARLAEQGFILRHEPDSLALSTVGGWIATRSIGAFATGCGGIARFVASLDVVPADGSFITVTTGDQAGPALAELFIGCEGSFGIVVAATLHVRPTPEARRFRAFACPAFLDGLEGLRGLIAAGIVPAASKLFDEGGSQPLAFQLQIDERGCLLFVIFEGPAALVEAQERLAVERLTATGAFDLGPAPAATWDQQRLGTFWFMAGNEGEGRLADRIDLFIPWDRVESVVEKCTAALTRSKISFASHSSQVLTHGVEITIDFWIDLNDDDAALDLHEDIWTQIMEIALDEGARIAHRHGYGRVRTPWLSRELGASHAALVAIKQALDPLGIMNPGRLLL
jgi:alkyldihydroxyacetonephosphate synthase